MNLTMSKTNSMILERDQEWQQGIQVDALLQQLLKMSLYYEKGHIRKDGVTSLLWPLVLFSRVIPVKINSDSPSFHLSQNGLLELIPRGHNKSIQSC